VQLYIQQQVQQQVQAALQQLPAPVAAPQPQQAGQQARFGSRSLPAPGTYSGATGGALEVYEREMKQRFEYYAVPDDGSRVRDAQMFLRGHALTWFSNLAAAPVTFAAYMTALRAMFEPLNSADTARHQLDKLQQQPKQSVHDYIAAFRMLLARVPDMSEQDRLHRFKAGLRKDLCMEVMRQGAANLEAAVGIAARYGTIGQVYGPAGAATVDSAAPMDLSNTELGESAPESVQGDAVAQIQELRGQVGEPGESVAAEEHLRIAHSRAVVRHRVVLEALFHLPLVHLQGAPCCTRVRARGGQRSRAEASLLSRRW
jgi:hypothetical protein